MYVVSNSYSSIFQYDVETGRPLPPIRNGDWPGVLVASDQGLHDPRFLAIGPDGDIYVGSGTQFGDLANGVYRFNKDNGSLMRVIGATTAKFPFGMAFGPDEMLYVNSYNTKTIQRYNPNNGEFLGDFASTENAALSIVFGPDGHLYVASLYTIERFNGQTGEPMGRFTSGRFIEKPYSLTFGPDSQLYVYDQTNYDIVRFNGMTGAFESVFIDGQYLFNPTCGIAFGPDGNLYTTNFVRGNTPVNDGIDRYDGRTGKYLGHFIVPSDRGGLVSAGIAFDRMVVPEPAVIHLAALSWILLTLRRRHHTRGSGEPSL